MRSREQSRREPAGSGLENLYLEAHIWQMTARGHFKAYLKCPRCGLSGVANLAELDEPCQTTMVEQLPRGFKVVNQPTNLASIDLFCERCDVSAITADNRPNIL
ncbi:hypothetical protein SAMN05444164_3832 [Bradyrhizobium erythrophlei]|uniref:Uncharacterized protein n=1 Tax=Bradyrhizobium erythrophlei TaxID=1437360 RepID=A0A1H4Y8G8_9BRAD|nr:hypothetical protein SAMN05444164_3832 [Bradyrhizobium erythrophlei]